MMELKKAYDQLDLGSFDKVVALLMKEVKQAETYKKNIYANIDEDVKRQIANRWKFAFEAFGYELRSE